MRLPWRFCLTFISSALSPFLLNVPCTLFSVYLPVRLYPHVILLFSLSPETVFFADFPPRTVTVLAIFLKFACRITVSDSRRSSAFSSSRVLYGATTLSRKASLLSPGFHGSGFRLGIHTRARRIPDGWFLWADPHFLQVGFPPG